VEPSLLVLTGPPGAGKSTVARLVSERLETSVLVEGDAFFAFLDQGAIAPWLAEADAQNGVVVRAAAAAAGRFAAGYATVYEGIIGPWFLPAFAEATGLSALHYAVLLPDVEVCVERVATRVGHGFSDEEVTRHMHAEFAQGGDGLDGRHLVGPTGGPDALATEILGRWAAGDLRYEA
jgi:predicted ABC-type ATPase